MSATDTIPIKLDDSERFVLQDLLEGYIHERVTEAVQFARNSIELERAAERVTRLAQARDMTWEGKLPRANLDAHLADFGAWLLEAEQTAQENQKAIADEDEDERRPRAEREKEMEQLRENIVTDYAHRTVCERIVAQLTAAREAVTA